MNGWSLRSARSLPTSGLKALKPRAKHAKRSVNKLTKPCAMGGPTCWSQLENSSPNQNLKPRPQPRLNPSARLAQNISQIMATSSRWLVSFTEACSGSEIKVSFRGRPAVVSFGEVKPPQIAGTCFISSPVDPAIPWRVALQQSPPLFDRTPEPKRLLRRGQCEQGTIFLKMP